MKLQRHNSKVRFVIRNSAITHAYVDSSIAVQNDIQALSR